MSLPQPPTLTRCYRHPDREAGRRCTRCGKTACSDCLVQAAVGSHCLDCAKAAQPDLKTRVKYASAKQPALVTQVLIAINIAVFVWVAIDDTAAIGGGRVTARQGELALNLRVINLTDEWYRLVTSGFLHFGILHIAINMYLLYQLGQMLERSLGRMKFGLLYTAGLFGGAAGVLLLSSATERSATGGASGAVFGLMAAAAISLHRQGINIFQTGIGMTLLINLGFTFLVPGISIGGHLGGMVAGAVCGAVMLAPKWKPVPKWARYATPVAVSLVAVAISVIRIG